MNLLSKVPIDLSSYPHLQRLYEHDKESFGDLTKGFMQMANHAAENNWNQESKEAFRMTVPQMMEALMYAVYDYDGIVSQHHNEHEKYALQNLKHENNPLSVLFGESTPRQADGEQISLAEFAGMDRISLKRWFQGMMYASRYVSHKDLAKHLLLGQFDLVEMEKAGHIQELMKIQPALQWQKREGIPLGQFLPRTGFFDLGKDLSNFLDSCPACDSPNWNKELKEKYAFCPDCKGAAWK